MAPADAAGDDHVRDRRGARSFEDTYGAAHPQQRAKSTTRLSSTKQWIKDRMEINGLQDRQHAARIRSSSQDICRIMQRNATVHGLQAIKFITCAS